MQGLAVVWKWPRDSLFVDEVTYLCWICQQHDLGDGGWREDGIERCQFCS